MKGPEKRASGRRDRRANKLAEPVRPGQGQVPVRRARSSGAGSASGGNGSAGDGRPRDTGEGAGIAWVTVAKPTRRRPWRMSLSNWPVSTRLGALFVAASVMGLLFGGLRVYDAVNAASGFARTEQLAELGSKATAFAQALENERDITAGYEGYQALQAQAKTDLALPATLKSSTKTEVQQAELTLAGAALPRTLEEQQAAFKVTDPLARQVASLAAGIGSAFPVDIQQKAQNVAQDAADLGFLRDGVAGQFGSPSVIIQDYEGTLDDLFLLDDEIASQTGDQQLSDEVRALGDLSRAKDNASQERAIVFGALAESAFPPESALSPTLRLDTKLQIPSILPPTALENYGGQGSVVAAADAQFIDTLDFESAATPAQAQTLLTTAVTIPIEDSQGVVAVLTAPSLVSEAIDPGATAGGTLPGALSTLGKAALVSPSPTSFTMTSPAAPALWFIDMSQQMFQMRSVEGQVANAIVARSQLLRDQAIKNAQLTAGVTAGAVLLVLLVTFLVARSMVNPLRRLQSDALEIAAVRLPARVAAAASGADPAAEDGAAMPTTIEPIGVQSTDEIGRVARAFDQVHAEAVRLAGTEAQLRGNLNAMFISLSRRSVPLIDRLARTVDSLEQNEDDPDRLASLFSMDHLVTRMRRNSENLLVLAGEDPVRKWTEPVPLADVTRAAAAEIEQYARVALAVQPGILISGQSVADIVHLLAELIENATLFSPRDTQVRVTAQELSTGGVLIEVRDDGVGVSANRLADMNWRLDHPPGVDVSVSRHMGLFAVSRLAARNGIRVRLRAAAPQGLSALIWLPGTLTSREPGVSGGLSSLTPVVISAEPTASGLRMPIRRGAGGRHRIGVVAAGDAQPALAGAAARQGTGPRSVWFASKNPSGRGLPGQNGSAAQNGSASHGGFADQNGFAAQNGSAAHNEYAGHNGFAPAQNGFAPAQYETAYETAQSEPVAGWQADAPVLPNWRFTPGAGMPASHSETAAGLPQRVPRASAFPGVAGAFGTPPGGFAVPPGEFGPEPGGYAGPNDATGGYPSLSEQRAWASAWGAGESDSPVFGARTGPDHVQEPQRRSPEAARSRMTGFQLGSRDAAQAGRTSSWTSSAGEEPSR